MTRRLQFAILAGLIAVVGARLDAAGPGSVAGVVRDSSGVPQIGAEVRLLRADLTPIASVYTDTRGRYQFASLTPGRYALKALGATYLPSLREGVRVHSKTIVNLTLNTLYEVMQWLPAEPRSAAAQHDDWEWTLRSAANRPLLRWLEDGPLVVVSEGPAARPHLMARLMATGGMGSFGESGERISASIEQTPSNSRELLARVDFDPSTDAGIESMLGFRQDLGFAGSVESVAAYALEPTVGEGGLTEASLRNWEHIHLGDEFEAEVGAMQALAHGAESGTLIEMLPFANVDWRSADGSGTVAYRMATSLPAAHGQDESQARAWLPAVAMRGNHLAMEHGLHQEFGYERVTEASGLSLLVYHDRLEDPVVEASGRLEGPAAEGALLDRATELMRAAGQSFSTTGFAARYEHRLGTGSRVRLSYANGDALVVAGNTPRAESAGAAARSLRPHHAQTYALALSGTLNGTGTRWRASYRWQPEDAVTRVAPFSEQAADPYLNLHVRQPIRRAGENGTGIDAMLDVRNLLAEGYRPYLLNDGSLLLFAQGQRAIRAGLSFTF